MTQSEIERKAEEDGFLRGYHDIPDNVKLHKMSFVDLAALLASCEGGSAKFNVVERELKKHLAKDQAEINRKNTGQEISTHRQVIQNVLHHPCGPPEAAQ